MILKPDMPGRGTPPPKKGKDPRDAPAEKTGPDPVAAADPAPPTPPIPTPAAAPTPVPADAPTPMRRATDRPEVAERTVGTAHRAFVPRVMMPVAIAVSVLVHAAVAYAVLDRPLGRIDPSLLREEPKPIFVKRAARDFVPSSGQAAGQGADEGTADAPSAADVVNQMLADEQPDTSDRDWEPEVDIRDPDAAPADADLDAGELDLLPYELSEAVLGSLTDAGATGGASDAEGAAAGLPRVKSPTAQSAARGVLATIAVAEAGAGGSGHGGAAGTRIGSGGDAAGGAQDVPDTVPDIDAALATTVGGPTGSEPTSADAGGSAAGGTDFADPSLIVFPELEEPQRLDDDFAYRVTRHAARGEDDYFRIDITAKRSLARDRNLTPMPKDVVFALDTSSSIPQEWIDEVKKAVKAEVRLLKEGDRFNILMFDENPRALSDRGVLPATPANIARADAFLDQAVSQGWTDVNAALRRLLVRSVPADRVYNMVLVSDGAPTRGVKDTRELINLITRDNDLVASIYCVGVGPKETQDRRLLDFLAYRNKGYSTYVESPAEMQQELGGLMVKLRDPLIKDVRLLVSGLEADTIYPRDLPNVHRGETFTLYGRSDGAQDLFHMMLSGNNAGSPVAFNFYRSVAAAPEGGDAVARNWAFWKLHHLYSELIRLGERPQIVQQIRALSEKYGFKSLY